jgi:RNA polymerase sigma-70 factor (ECF subfamily)
VDRAELERRLRTVTATRQNAVRRFMIEHIPEHESPDDAAGELFFRVTRDIGTLTDDGAFWGWFWKIAARVAVDVSKGFKRRRKHETVGGEDFEKQAAELEAPEPDAPAPSESEEKERRVREALAALPEELRQVMSLKYHSGLTQAEIGDALDLSPTQVANRVRAGYQKLREALEDLGP